MAKGTESRVLTKAQKRWCELVNSGLSGAAACQKIRPQLTPGSAKTKAWVLRQMPHIQAYLAELDARACEEAAVTKTMVLEDLKALKDRCMQAEQVLDREGKPTGEYKFDSNGANRALELIGKHLRMWQEGGGQSVSVNTENGGIQVIISDPTRRADAAADPAK